MAAACSLTGGTRLRLLSPRPRPPEGLHAHPPCSVLSSPLSAVSWTQAPVTAGHTLLLSPLLGPKFGCGFPDPQLDLRVCAAVRTIFSAAGTQRMVFSTRLCANAACPSAPRRTGTIFYDEINIAENIFFSSVGEGEELLVIKTSIHQCLHLRDNWTAAAHVRVFKCACAPRPGLPAARAGGTPAPRWLSPPRRVGRHGDSGP